MERVEVFLKAVRFPNFEALLLATALVVFLLGLALLYRKGPMLGVPISIVGILLVVLAALSKLFSS